MAKDPACLFYWGDWAGGTSTFSRHLKGCYMDLLNAQFNCGPLSLDEIKTILGTDFGFWPTLQKKFEKSENGLFFNTRLQEEKNKRNAYVKSRKKNLEHHMSPHMENGNENRNVIENENGDFGKRENLFFAERFKIAFDGMTLEAYARNFKGIDIGNELNLFRLKCDNDKADYHNRDIGGLRNGFQAQLTKAKPIMQKKKAFNL